MALWGRGHANQFIRMAALEREYTTHSLKQGGLAPKHSLEGPDPLGATNSLPHVFGNYPARIRVQSMD